MHTLLRHTLDGQPGFVILDGPEGAEIEDQVAQLSPDVVVLELAPDDPDRIRLIRRLVARSPTTQVLALLPHCSIELARRSLRARACGCLVAETAVTEIAEAVMALYAGHFYLSRPIWDGLMDDYVRSRERVKRTYTGNSCC